MKAQSIFALLIIIFISYLTFDLCNVWQLLGEN